MMAAVSAVADPVSRRTGCRGHHAVGKPSAHSLEHDLAEADQPFGDAGFAHEISREDEERNGHERKGRGRVVHLLRHDAEGQHVGKEQIDDDP